MRRELVISLLLVGATLAVYGQVLSFDFVNWDDPHYVTGNARVQEGLTSENVVSAFADVLASNWHPLTALSHMLDVQRFGLDPAGHHATNVLLHVANALLLFWVLHAMTGAAWCSALVAALFALHPLHVESVAWVSGRKDVLSTFFGLLSMRAYVAYARRGGARWFALTAACFALGLLAKPMLVTLPLVFLLLDLWPLDRFRLGRPATAALPTEPGEPRMNASQLVTEKLPLLALSMAAGCVTLIVQDSGEMVAGTGTLTIGSRVQNALLSYVRYAAKMVWPGGLSIWYPHPDLAGGTPWAGWQIAGAAVLLALASVAVFRSARRYLWVGWLWYLGTLLPVIGLVQVGRQAMADRYTYVPLVGLFLIAAWGAADIAGWLRVRKSRLGPLLPSAAVLAVVACGLSSWQQVHVWRDSLTLNRHALRLAPGSPVVHNQLGRALDEEGQLDEAIVHYRAALRTRPDYDEVHEALGIALAKQGKFDEALPHFQHAVALNPGDAASHHNLSNVYWARGDTESAIRHLQRALQLQPDMVPALVSLGMLLAQQGMLDPAVEALREAVALAPENGQAQLWLGIALRSQGESAASRRHLQAAERLGFTPPR